VKRVLDVIEIFARISHALPARLLMIGDGPDRSAAEFLALRLGVADRIDFVGKQENVNELLALSDLMLMPSEMESFGLAALEAMACRVPAIATRVGGVPELIDDGRSSNGLSNGIANGLLYEVGAVEAMAEGAIWLLSDPARLKAMSDAARRTAQDHFCASRIIPQYERYYEEIVATSLRSTAG
jgi:N-acetyl-alpha-D-glucosaminyl L-malate synthase BshA